jgi:outer membrane immunogenic protein
MKKFVLTGALLGASVVSAFAADLSVAPMYQGVARPVYSWTGCNIGANLGGGIAENKFWDTTGLFLGQPGWSLGSHNAHNGVVGGGQLYCDYQAGPIVFGLEGLYDLTGLKGYNQQPDAVPAVVLWNNTFVQSIGRVTGRLGVTLTPTVLLYARGGRAWIHDIYRISTMPGGRTPDPATIVNVTIGEGAATRSGWTAGMGVEWAVLGSDVSLFVEYDYMSFGTYTVTFKTANALATRVPWPLYFPIDVAQKANIVLFGVNWRFAGGRKWN